MDISFPTLKDYLLQLNKEIQDYKYEGDVGILTRDIPKKLQFMADFMLTNTSANKELSDFVKNHSVEWLNEEADELKSVGLAANDEKRIQWLTFSKKWTNEAVKSFIYYCNYFEPSILTKQVTMN